MPLLQDYNKLFEHTDNIKKIYVNNNVVWPSVLTPPGPDYSEPFYVENISNTVETLRITKLNYSAPTLTIEYSTDKTTWTPFENSTSTTALTYILQPNDKLYLRCNTVTWANFTYDSNAITGVSKVGGNIMSLLYGSGFTGQETSFPSGSTYNFTSLFYNNTNLVDASELLLSATTLTDNCYYNMFSYCVTLTTAPVLPATTLAEKCYLNMFRNCASLTTAPALPATTLVNSCYGGMFFGCASLTTAPMLPATTLVQECYGDMFGYCTLLNNITCLATDISASYACGYWLSNVSSTGTFTKAAGVTWPTGVSGIPSGWTVVEV